MYFPCRPGQWEPLVGRGLLTELPLNGDRNADNIDVGVFDVSDKFSLDSKSENAQDPIHASNLLSHALPRDNKRYLLIGIPQSKSRYSRHHKEIRINCHALICSHANYDSYDRLNVTPLTNIILNFDEKQNFSVSGERVNFPTLHGMSGSPVFLFSDDYNIVDPLFTPVVGVFMGVLEGKATC